MNCPKKNTYPKHYEISDQDIILGAIYPKPWRSVFVAQVDIIILIAYDKIKYRSQAITVCPRL